MSFSKVKKALGDRESELTILHMITMIACALVLVAIIIWSDFLSEDVSDLAVRVTASVMALSIASFVSLMMFKLF